MRVRYLLPLLIVLAILVFVGAAVQSKRRTAPEKNPMFTVESPSFPNGAAIPAKYTCKGQDASPPLRWSDPPKGTQSLALILDDPDAPGGTFTHWVLYGIAPGTRELPENFGRMAEAAGLGKQGRNDFGKIGYGGPCPPPGGPHRYFFRLHALDAKLDLPANASRGQLESAMKDHIVATAETMGTFGR